MTRDEYDNAALKGSRAELHSTLNVLRGAAARAGDDRKGSIMKRLLEIAEVDVAELSTLGGSRPMTDESVDEVTQGITERGLKLAREIREGRFSPQKPESG